MQGNNMFWDIFATFVNTAAAFQEGEATQRAAVFNQSIAKYNANQTRQSGILEEDRVRREARKATGIMTANMGASGLGGAEDLLAESIYNGELDALTTRYNYNSKAQGLDMQAAMYGAGAKSANTSKYIGAAAALLKGGTNYYKNSVDLSSDKPFKLGGATGAQKQTPYLNTGD